MDRSFSLHEFCFPWRLLSGGKNASQTVDCWTTVYDTFIIYRKEQYILYSTVHSERKEKNVELIQGKVHFIAPYE